MIQIPVGIARSAGVGLAAAAGLSACVTHAPLADSYGGPEELPPALAERFAYEPRPVQSETDRVRERRAFAIHEVTLPALDGARDETAGGDEPIALEYYDVGAEAPTPVVVLLPIVNGNMLVSRYFARYFAARGWAAVVVDHAGEPLDGALENPEHAIHGSILDYRRVLDWVAAQPEFTTIGVFGISFGGMAAVMLAALDERIDAVVAAMAGGDIPSLIMSTSYRLIAREVQRMRRDSGLSRDDLEAQLEELVLSDPLELAPYVDAEDIMLVLTRTDLIVPFELQEALRKSLGEPESLYLPTGHRTSVFYFPLLRSSAYQFFERQFSASR